MQEAQGAEISLCCLLWAKPGQEAGLTAYEDQVLAYISEHGGKVVQRVATDGADRRPHEIQMFAFADQAALDSYLGDPRRAALAAERDRVVERTELFPVSYLELPGPDLARLRRWEDAGALWKVVSRIDASLTIALCTCDGGEEVDRFSSAEPQLLAYVGSRDELEGRA